MTFVLASSSPRRKELLKKLGLKFISCHPLISEIAPGKYSSMLEQTRYLACLKAEKAQEKFPDSLILSADTLVGIKEKIFGKPATKREAFQMLKVLNGDQHEVITTIALLKKNRMIARSIVTKVWFFRKPQSFLRWYLSTGEYRDKAGAYGIQGYGSLLVKKIEGDYYNVVGLPVGVVWELLRKFNSKGIL